jgi:uncharacterized membrane protein
MKDLTEYLTNALVGVILLVALVPVIISQATGANWTISLAGVTIDLTIFLFIIVLLVVLGAMAYVSVKKGRK